MFLGRNKGSLSIEDDEAEAAEAAEEIRATAEEKDAGDESTFARTQVLRTPAPVVLRVQRAVTPLCFSVFVPMDVVRSTHPQKINHNQHMRQQERILHCCPKN